MFKLVNLEVVTNLSDCCGVLVAKGCKHRSDKLQSRNEKLVVALNGGWEEAITVCRDHK